MKTFAAFAVVTFLVGCGAGPQGPGTINGCGPDNCQGCCAADGVCQLGKSDEVCGANGAACGTCGAGMVCSAAGKCDAAPACTPATCTSLSAGCGELPDGCGGTLRCGDCPSGQNCGGAGPNQCGTASCTPRTCAALGATCGSVSDGCGKQLACGSCIGGESCVGNVCHGGGAGGGGGSSGGGAGGGAAGGTGGGSSSCGAGCPGGYLCQAGVCVGGNAENLTLDVKSPAVISVGGTINYNGAPTAIRYASSSCGTLKLIDAAGKATSITVECNAGSNVTFQGRVVAGVYRAELSAPYSLVVPSTTLGVDNLDFRTSKLNAVLDFTGPAAVNVKGSVLKNGAKPVVLSTGSCGSVYFEAATTAQSISLPLTCSASGGATFDGLVFAQTYDVTVNGGITVSDLPIQKVRTGLAVTAGLGALTLNTTGGARIDLGGTITINTKSPLFIDGFSRFALEFQSTAIGAAPVRYYLNQNVGTYKTALLAGSYDVTVLTYLSGTTTPIARKVLQSASLTASNAALNFDVTLALTPLAITTKHNGVTLGGNDCYLLELTSVSDGTKFSSYCPTSTSFVKVPAGTYTAKVSAVEGSSVPNGWWPATGNVVVPASPASTPISINVTTPGVSKVSMSVLHNGAAPVVFGGGSSSCGSVIFTPASGTEGASASFSCSSSSGFTISAARITRGTYKVSVLGDQHASSLPNTPKVVLPALSIQSDLAGQVLDVKTPAMAKVSGRVLSNGTSPLVIGTSSTCGEAIFQNLNGVDHQRLTLQCSNAGQITFEGLLVSGTYQVLVKGDPARVLLPPVETTVIPSLAVP